MRTRILSLAALSIIGTLALGGAATAQQQNPFPDGVCYGCDPNSRFGTTANGRQNGVVTNPGPTDSGYNRSGYYNSRPNYGSSYGGQGYASGDNGRNVTCMESISTGSSHCEYKTNWPAAVLSGLATAAGVAAQNASHKVVVVRVP